jgi:hypothetical protein
MRRRQIVSYDWDKYDQSHIVFQPTALSTDQLYRGYLDTYDGFYTVPSMLRRFPYDGSRSRAYWTIYNAFFRKGGIVTRDKEDFVGVPTPPPDCAAVPPIMPQKAAWRALVEGTTSCETPVEVGNGVEARPNESAAGKLYDEPGSSGI